MVGTENFGAQHLRADPVERVGDSHPVVMQLMEEDSYGFKKW